MATHADPARQEQVEGVHEQDPVDLAEHECSARARRPGRAASRTTVATAPGYCEIGKNVAENRNMGMMARFTKSKSSHVRMNVVPAMPAPANANAMSSPPGIASTAHHDSTRPNAAS